MAGAAYTLSNGIYHSKMYPWLQNQLTGMVARYSYDKDARWVLDMIQVNDGSRVRFLLETCFPKALPIMENIYKSLLFRCIMR